MNFDSSVLWANSELLVSGFLTTLRVSAISIVLGFALGLAACLAQMLGRGPLWFVAKAYIEIFRTLPEMVTIFWVYSCLPFLFDVALPAESTGILVLTLCAGAFSAEVIRAGIQSLPKGQFEASYALGLGSVAAWRDVILPQALKTVSPALVLIVADIVKASGLLSAITVAELVYQAYVIGGQTFRYYELFTFVGIAYFVIIFPLSLLSRWMSRTPEQTGVARFAKGQAQSS